MSRDQIPEPWLSFLQQIDASLHEQVEWHCFGGFVVTMCYERARATVDLDVVRIAPGNTGQPLLHLAGKGSELHQRFGVYLDYVSVAAIPEDYDHRLTEMFPGTFQHLRLYAFDPYDVALAKLERNLQRDRDDVKHLARTIPFDLRLFQERYESELRPYLGNPEREDLTVRLWIEAIEEERQSQA